MKIESPTKLLVICLFVAITSSVATMVVSNRFEETPVVDRAGLKDAFNRPINVVYCARDIHKNQIFVDDDFCVKEVPYSRVPANAIDSIYTAIGRRSQFEMKKGDYVDLFHLGLQRKMKEN